MYKDNYNSSNNHKNNNEETIYYHSIDVDLIFYSINNNLLYPLDRIYEQEEWEKYVEACIKPFLLNKHYLDKLPQGQIKGHIPYNEFIDICVNPIYATADTVGKIPEFKERVRYAYWVIRNLSTNRDLEVYETIYQYGPGIAHTLGKEISKNSSLLSMEIINLGKEFNTLFLVENISEFYKGLINGLKTTKSLDKNRLNPYILGLRKWIYDLNNTHKELSPNLRKYIKELLIDYYIDIAHILFNKKRLSPKQKQTLYTILVNNWPKEALEKYHQQYKRII